MTTLTVWHLEQRRQIKVALDLVLEQLITIPGTLISLLTWSAVKCRKDCVDWSLLRMTWKSELLDFNSSWFSGERDSSKASFAPASKKGKTSPGLVWYKNTLLLVQNTLLCLPPVDCWTNLRQIGLNVQGQLPQTIHFCSNVESAHHDICIHSRLNDTHGKKLWTFFWQWHYPCQDWLNLFFY